MHRAKPIMPSLDQQYFDCRLPAKKCFRIGEVGAFLGVSESMIEKLIESGRINCHALNAGNGVRMTRRIPREMVILFLLQTRQYQAEDYVAGVLGLLERMSRPELTMIRDRLPVILARAVTRETDKSQAQGRS